MTAPDSRARYEELVADLNEHDRRYYIEMNPSISDQEYDRRYAELKRLEAKHPDWIATDSPTQRVAPAPLGKTLSGRRLEYLVLELQAGEAGKREATLKFDAGQGTQDLGFRAEVPILFRVR